MKLHEYQSKQIFTKFGIPIPLGRVANSSGNVRQIAEELGSKVVVKAQVLSGGRGKAGGISLAETPENAEKQATQIMGMTINNFPVHKVLVEEAVNIEKEIYLGIVIDRANSIPLLIASAQGGIDIEETALYSPEKIYKIPIPLLLGLREYQTRSLALAIDLPKNYWRIFMDIASGVWQIFKQFDATLVEINPLVITADSHMLALDGKIDLDENALFRHPELIELRDLETEDPSEAEARKYGLAYIRMTGNVGCMVNGAGLAMATMDMIKLFGGEPANFLDIGGGASAEKVAAAFRIILSDLKIRSVIINIFGGITRCDEVAKGLIKTIDEIKPKTPIVLRLEGNHAQEGYELLKKAHLRTVQSFSEAAEMVVALALQEAHDNPD
jgi:succinyl-CoA synthetase beta subunit